MCQYCEPDIQEMLPDGDYVTIPTKIFYTNDENDDGTHWMINGAAGNGGYTERVFVSIWFCPVCGRELPQE